MEQSLLSVIVPVYNVAPYLRQCVQSLLSQTYAHLEIILIDDGSTDGSGELCDCLAREDPRVVVIHQKNSGVSAARNAGLEIARGSYIGFVDSDDWVEPEMYATLISRMENDQSDAAFCGYWEDFDQEGRPPVAHSPARTGKVGKEEAIYQCLIGSDVGYYIINCNKCYRRELVWAEGKPTSFPVGVIATEDELWFARVMQNLSSASLTSQMFYHWRQRGSSASHTIRSDNALRKVLQAHKESAELFAAVSRYGDLARGRVYDSMFRCVWMAYYLDDKENERYFRRELAPYRRIFWKSQDFSKARKLKFLLVDWMCRLRLPKEWVTAVEQATRR